MQEHNDNLRGVLQRAREKNVKFRKSKCSFGQQEVPFVGNVISKDGVKPDPMKVRAILEMPDPQDKTDLQRIIGMLNYLGRFIPNFSDKTSLLRSLLKKDVFWHWLPEHHCSLVELKQLLVVAPVLRFYDPKMPVTISVDASKSGLGAVLLQKGAPVSYASRALTLSEINYSQIEKELLAIVFGLHKFRQYVYGTSVGVEMDHKPLEAIFKKSFHQIPPRLQRMMMTLQPFSFSVHYRPGKEMYVSDTLSRAFLPEAVPEIDPNEIEHYVHALVRSLPVSEQKLSDLRLETSRDLTLQSLRNFIEKGWPRRKSEMPMELRQFWSYRHELSYGEGLLFKGTRILIPSSLRPVMLARIHESHLGIEKCRSRARDAIFWPGLNVEIENLVASCTTCQRFRNYNQKELLRPHEVPHLPWEKVGVDLFVFDDRNYGLCVDYFSRFFEIVALRNSSTSCEVILTLKALFSRHGIPAEVFTDNGPQFSSGEFSSFAESWKFMHTTSSPRYPQSNGMAERAVQTAKNLLKKAKHSGSDPYLAILDYRNSPLADVGLSPAQLLMSRRLATRFPMAPEQLIPGNYDIVATRSCIQRGRVSQSKNYNRSAKHLPTLKTGEQVMMYNSGSWVSGQVLEKRKEPRSYNVRAENSGQLYRRNRRDLSRVKVCEPDHPNVYLPVVHSDNGSLEEESDALVPFPMTTRSGRHVRPPRRLIEEL